MLPVFGWKIIEEGEQSLSILNQTLGYLQACPSPSLNFVFYSSHRLPFPQRPSPLGALTSARRA